MEQQDTSIQDASARATVRHGPAEVRRRIERMFQVMRPRVTAAAMKSARFVGRMARATWSTVWWFSWTVARPRLMAAGRVIDRWSTRYVSNPIIRRSALIGCLTACSIGMVMLVASFGQHDESGYSAAAGPLTPPTEASVGILRSTASDYATSKMRKGMVPPVTEEEIRSEVALASKRGERISPYKAKKRVQEKKLIEEAMRKPEEAKKKEDDERPRFEASLKELNLDVEVINSVSDDWKSAMGPEFEAAWQIAWGSDDLWVVDRFIERLRIHNEQLAHGLELKISGWRYAKSESDKTVTNESLKQTAQSIFPLMKQRDKMLAELKEAKQNESPSRSKDSPQPNEDGQYTHQLTEDVEDLNRRIIAQAKEGGVVLVYTSEHPTGFATEAAATPTAQGEGIFDLVEHDDLDGLRKLLAESPALAKTTNALKRTPLHLAKSARVAQLLIENGADVNAKDGKDLTPLHFVASDGDPAVAKVLLDHRADVNARSATYLRPHEVAVISKHSDISKMIRANSTEIADGYFQHMQGSHGAATAHYSVGVAFFEGRPEIIQNDDLAIMHFEEAANLGHPDAETAMGSAYETGFGGVAKDRTKAIVMYRRAAAQGHDKAKERLRALGVK